MRKSRLFPLAGLFPIQLLFLAPAALAAAFTAPGVGSMKVQAPARLRP